MTAADPPPRRLRRFTSSELWLGLLVLAALATRLPFLTHGIDEFDAANFATALIKFQIPHNNPHPPGQYYFVLLGRAVNFFVHDELTALSLAGALFSCLTAIPLFYLLRLVCAGNARLAFLASALSVFTYGFWLTGLRPVSDPEGSFFVYLTLCALLYGLDRPGWFCAGMALFAVTLGVKQLSLYFLAPVVIIVNLIVLLKGRWRGVLLGALLFGLLFLGWLIPSVRNCGGWSQYVLGCRTGQQWGYLYESLITHRTWDRFYLQVQHNLLDPWGSTAVAVPVLMLAVVGALYALRQGQKAVLFVIFGASTVIYIFLVMYIFGKYNMYYVPVYCSFAVLGLHALSLRLARWADPAAFSTTGAALLIGCGLGATFPPLVRLPGFRPPMESIGEDLISLNRRTGNVGVVTDNGIVSNDLKYYANKGKFAYAPSFDYPAMAHLLSTNKRIYLISSSRTNGLEPDLVPLNHFHWYHELFGIMEGRDSMRDLYLYRMEDLLAPEFAFTGPHRLPQPFLDGIYGDGWAQRHVSFLLPVDAALEPILHLDGLAPQERGINYPYRVRYQFEGGAPGDFTLEHSGPFDVNLALFKASGPKELSLEFWLPQDFNPSKVIPGSTDDREITLKFAHIRMSNAAQPLFTKQETGWYERETDGKDWWYWSAGDGTIQAAAERPGTLIITAQMSLVTPGNSIDVMLDGALAATVTAPTTDWVPETLRVPITPGVHTITFHSRQPGLHPPHDPRTLALGVKDLAFTLE